MRVHACQLDLIWESPRANLQQIDTALDTLTTSAQDFCIFPEMATTGFSMAAVGQAEPPAGQAEELLASLARRHQIHLGCGLAVREREKAANQFVAFTPDGAANGRYTKLHPFPLASEAGVFPAGNRITLFRAGGLTFCPLICFDLRFPEPFARAASAGAQAFIVVANWPVYREDHWVTLVAARAVENQAYVIAVNRCGSDPEHHYPGRTMIVDPQGQCLADAGDTPGTISADLEPEVVDAWRSEFPSIAQRRDPATIQLTTP